MASNRIVINRSTLIGGRLADMVAAIETARSKVSAMQKVFAKYNADATLATDAGMSAGDQTALTNLLIQSDNELNGLASTTVTSGQPTGIRQLADAISIGV